MIKRFYTPNTDRRITLAELIVFILIFAVIFGSIVAWLFLHKKDSFIHKTGIESSEPKEKIENSQ